MAEKLWGGRFDQKTASRMDAFSSSFPIDARLFGWDVLGSMAHARMLARQGVIGEEDGRALLRGLEEIYREGPPAMATTDWEDVHSYVECRLHQLVGEAAGRLHTARSRNDQVALDLRLFARATIVEQAGLLAALMATLVQLAEEHADDLMPGYTHLQRAQPVVLGHHFLAYVEQLARDVERLKGAYARADVLPLGSGALAGVPYPLDRQYVADLLGFSAISRNSLDAVSDRDFVVEHLAALALIAVHLSRLGEEMVLWSSAEFGFLELSDAYATGSSIMPQKKNPDVAELVRGKSGRVFGSLVAVLTMLKGLPLSYNRDLQEDKAPYFEAVDTVSGSLEILADALKTATIQRERLEDAARGGFATATDLADYLARKGLAFREAHEVVGKMVRWCIEHRRELHDLRLDELRTFSSLFESEAVGMSAEQSVAARDLPGGTAPAQVRTALSTAREALRQSEGWIAARSQSLPTIESPGGAGR